MCLLISLFVVFFSVHSASMNESASKMLSEHLSDNYGSTAIRPVKNPSETVVVTFRVLVAQVIEFVSIIMGDRDRMREKGRKVEGRY